MEENIKPLTEKRTTKQLRRLSTYTKIGVQFTLFAAVVIVPKIIPKLRFENHAQLTWNLLIVLCLSIFFEIWTRSREKQQKSFNFIVSLQIITGVLMLSHFMYYLGRINGPLFFIYGMMIMEASLNLNITLPFVVSGIIFSATLGEFALLAHRNEIIISLTTIVFLVVRIGFILLMTNYARSMSKNIIKEHETAQSLHIAYQKLKKLDKAKSEFVSIASHQLRTPLAAIKGYLSMFLEGDYGALSKNASKAVENVYQSNERLIGLVNSLLNLSRLESGKIKVVKTDISLSKMLSGIEKEFLGRAATKGIKLVFEKPKEKIPHLKIDEEKICEVIANLVDNAIKYTSSGSVIITALENKEKETILISVKDTGEGMSKEDIAKLFQSFSRAGAGNKFWTEGTGLGLYIAKKFIKMHHGNIWAESGGRGKGSQFCIELPLK